MKTRTLGLTEEESDAMILAESLGFDFSFLKSPADPKKKYKVPSKIERKKEARKVAAL